MAMDNDELYVYLISNDSRSLFPNNSPSHFTNQLDVPLDFGSDVRRWEVGLCELEIPRQFYNILDENDKFYITYAIEENRQKRNIESDDEEHSERKKIKEIHNILNNQLHCLSGKQNFSMCNDSLLN